MKKSKEFSVVSCNRKEGVSYASRFLQVFVMFAALRRKGDEPAISGPSCSVVAGFDPGDGIKACTTQGEPLL